MIKITFSLFLIAFVNFSAGHLEDWQSEPIDSKKFETNSNPSSSFPEDAVINKDYLEAIIEARRFLEGYKAQNRIPGLVISVSVEGATVWSEAFGYSDLENGVRASHDTFMRIASVSKTFTGVFAAKLVDEGRLDLDVPIQDYLGEEVFPRKQWRGRNVNITTRHLLSHTAGIRASDFDRVDARRIVQFDNQTARIVSVRNDPLIFEPGTNWTYSNWGIDIAAAVVETIIQKNYVDEIERFYRKNFGLEHTRVDSADLHSHRSRYYALDKNDVVLGPLVDEVIMYVNTFAGGLVSTVGDLVKYGNALLDIYKGKNGFLESGTIRQLWQQNPVSVEEVKRMIGENADGQGYGLTFVNQTYTQTRHASGSCNIAHSGGLYGASSQFAIFPDTDLVVGYISNLGQYMTRPHIEIADIFAKKRAELNN